MTTILLSTDNSYALAKKIAKILDVQLCLVKAKKFHDGELEINCHIAPSKHLVLISSMYPNGPESFLELILIVREAKKNGVKKVTVIAPYIVCGRSKNFDHILYILQCSGVDRVYTVDPHVYNEEMIKKYHLYKVSSMIDIVDKITATSRVDLLVAADHGRESFVRELSRIARIPYAVLKKIRIKDGACVIEDVPDVKGKRILLVDDIIDTGNTLLSGSRSLQNANASEVHVFVTHALGDVGTYYTQLFPFIDTLTITDSITNMWGSVDGGACRVISMAPTLAKVIAENL